MDDIVLFLENGKSKEPKYLGSCCKQFYKKIEINGVPAHVCTARPGDNVPVGCPLACKVLEAWHGKRK